MEELNPIACDNCRFKKCKCDRKIPSCSQCQSSSSLCHYQEGGKRGIPVAYMSDLEKRLLETEAALQAALRALEERNGIPAPNLPIPEPKPLASWRERSKSDRQEEWKRLPLRTNENLVTWFREKCQEAPTSILEPAEPFSRQESGVEAQPVDVRSTKRIRRADLTAPGPNEPCVSPAAASSSTPAKTVNEQLRNMSPATAPNTSTLSLESAKWRNYF